MKSIRYPFIITTPSATGERAWGPRLKLFQNYPNPFNPTTIIRYQLPQGRNVLLKVYDILGREVATLVNEVKPPGTYTVQFDASGLASGMYFYRLDAGHFMCVRKLMLLR